jgi:sugar O-acyltransferase (sialic acid O-acetyltransferase NeuD family)
MELAIVGYGGHAREVAAQLKQPVTFFVDEQYLDTSLNQKSINSFDPEQYTAMIAIADPESRYRIVQRLPKDTKYFTWIHPTALILDESIEIGEGSFIGPYSVLTTNIKIGQHCILNRGNHIGHDSKIGDYFSAMPGAIVSGNVTIQDLVYMGTNSSIREKLSVEGPTTIGMNAAVIKSIQESGTYTGVPAKKLR